MSRSRKRQQPGRNGSREREHALVLTVREAVDPGRAAVDRLVAARDAQELLARAELDAWEECRYEGLSWSQLAGATGVGRSGAQRRAAQLAQRFARLL